MDPQTQLDLSNLSDADKKELNQALTNEAQKSTIQQGTLPSKHHGRVDDGGGDALPASTNRS